jgi:hypothetical protein
MPAEAQPLAPFKPLPPKIDNPLLRRAAKLAAAYRAALKPRLLVPVGMAAAVAVWNRLSGSPLPLLYEGCMMGGFLAYKGALLTKLLQELLPKVRACVGARARGGGKVAGTRSPGRARSRPQRGRRRRRRAPGQGRESSSGLPTHLPRPLLHSPTPQSYGSKGESRPKLETIDDELDQWGRPKKAARTPIDALPEDAQAKALEQLEKQMGDEPGRGHGAAGGGEAGGGEAGGGRDSSGEGRA